MEILFYDEELQIKNYLDNLYINENCSSTETQNFLRDYLNVILLSNGINPRKLAIDMHFDKDFGANVGAFVYPKRTIKGYDVHFRKDMLSMHNKSEFNKILTLIIYAGHEFEHIVQFENSPKRIRKFYNSKDILCDMATSAIEQSDSDRKCRKILHLVRDHLDQLGLLSSTEIDADTYSYADILSLLDKFAMVEPDDQLIEYYNALAYAIISHMKDRKKSYKIKRDEYKKTHGRLEYCDEIFKDFNLS